MASINVNHAWAIVLNRDRHGDGRFVYAVSSTGVYCRPSCPSRRPARRHVTFFNSPHRAESAGYRACHRCLPQSLNDSKTEQRVEQARNYLDEHADELITLRRLAAQVGGSPFHLQRSFTRVVGLSPKAYQGAQRMARFAAALKRGETVTNATYDAGFGSSSRLYAHVHEELGMTPSAFRSGGRGVTLRHATVPTPVGLMLVAMTRRGIVAVSFGDSEVALVASLQHDFPKAVLRRDTKGLARHVSCLLRCLNGRADVDRLQLDIRATTFQRKVWRALQQIPRGQTRAYREIARAIGQPTAARAVAKACAGNPVAMAIPCHRAVRSDGRLAGYRWGVERKQQLLVLERT